jgi:hypothetical protein
MSWSSTPVEVIMQPRKAFKSMADNAAFLANRFDLPPRKAAELVSGEGTLTDEIAADVAARQHNDDVLEGVPTPEQPTYEHGIDMDEVRLKPVLRQRNDRSGGA